MEAVYEELRTVHGAYRIAATLSELSDTAGTLCFRSRSATGTPLSASLRISAICISLRVPDTAACDNADGGVDQNANRTSTCLCLSAGIGAGSISGQPVTMQSVHGGILSV